MNHRSQIAITKINGTLTMVYMEEEKLFDVLVEEAESLAVGDIYVGKVQNIVQNINAAFVEVQKNVICFLPLNECKDKKIKSGDEIVVQVRKAAVKTKQAVVSLFPEMAGRFCAVTTRNKEKGISKKIQDKDELLRLQNVLDKLGEIDYGLVLRTNAVEASEEDILFECKQLLEEMKQCMEFSQYKTCFSLVRKEISFYEKYIQGCQMENIHRIITDERAVFDELETKYKTVLEFYEDTSYSLDKLLGISSKLEKALEKQVWLKSGGNIVIEVTEALTVIDVNTGKAIEGKRNKETTFYKINYEAAKEAARQIRLRNISGIILIDFIDMKIEENQQELLNLLRGEFKKDKTRTILVDITKLGLVEITRMKVNRPLWEMFGRM